MKKLRLQHFRFTHRAVLSSFLTNPENFIHLFEENGTDFLDFLWRCSGEDLEESELVKDDGLVFEIRNYNAETKIIIITLPQPQSSSEVFIIGLVNNPKIQIARAFTLEYRLTDDHKYCKVIFEWKVDGTYKKVNDNCDPFLEIFYQEVCKMIDAS